MQLSRIINPNDVEDRCYLEGLPAGTAPPKPDEAWFGVWMRVQNTTDSSALAAAEEFEIVDTQENAFTPIELEEQPVRLRGRRSSRRPRSSRAPTRPRARA